MNTGGNKLKKTSLIITALILLLLPAISSGTDWEYFIQDNKGDSHYIDLDSIEHTSSGTARILKKVEATGHSQYTSLVSNIEMDCRNRKIRTLKETALTKDGKSRRTRKDRKWQDVHSDDINELLFELVCSLRKSRN